MTLELYCDRQALAVYMVDAIDRWARTRGYEPAGESFSIYKVDGEIEHNRHLIELVIFRRYRETCE